jgi:diguanylate cyclase (GGDEF)-like protein
MAFFEALRDALHAPEPEPRRIAVLCVSLDRFKEFTDLFGRPVADKLLRDIGIRLGATARLTFLAYDGAGAFLMIVREHAAEIEPLAILLQATGNSEVDIEGHRVKPSSGVGIARFPEEGTDAESLIGSAEAAAFYAKADKNRPLRFFDPEMERKLKERRIIATELRRALERDELVLFYQPQTTLDGEITGFEALLRWRHPTRGLVMPGNFLPIAEEIGLVIDIGAWVLKEACREAATWGKPLKIAVNLSPSQLQASAFPNVVEAILAETGLQPGRLELEITESALIGDFQRAFSSLRRIKALGVLIAMDDFGTGYSSLSNLRAFPFDRIKIEGSFVADMETNRQSACIVRATIALGRSLGIPVTAEGVETRSQLEFLAREHCAEVQGFVNGIPMPIRVYADVVGRRPEIGTTAAGSKAVG